MLERGRRTPSFATIDVLATALRINPLELISE